jgi:hypothetical protein
LAERGLTRKPRSALMEVLGESAGAVLPVAAAAKAPQIARGVLKAAENAAAPKAAGQAAAQRGAIVWHGSPHKFDRFDSSKIGTGEGAQAYGHGLYLAESPEVAKQYQKTLSADGFLVGDKVFDPSSLAHLNVRSITTRGDLDGAIAKAKAIAASDSPVANLAAKDLARLQEIKAAGGLQQNAGALYKVDLPDEQIAKMLDWDKPLSQQAPAARAAIEKIAPKNRSGQPMLDLDANGGELLRALGLGDGSSSLLRQQGIPGIRYLDGSSRGAGAGTSNFVVFPGEEEALRILERNGQPLGILDVLR